MIEMKATARGVFGTGLKPETVWHGDRFTEVAIKSAVARASEESIPVRVGGLEVGRATLSRSAEDGEILASIIFTCDDAGILGLFKDAKTVSWRGQIVKHSSDTEGQRTIEATYLEEITPEVATPSTEE